MPSGIHRSDARLSYSRLYRHIDGFPKLHHRLPIWYTLGENLEKPHGVGKHKRIP